MAPIRLVPPEPSHLAAATGLRLVQRVVSPFNERFDGAVVRFGHRHTDTAPELPAGPLALDHRVGDERTNTSGEKGWAFRAALPQPPHDELIPAESGDDIGGS